MLNLFYCYFGFSYSSYFLHIMLTPEICIATINDINQLQQIGRQTFSETFADENSEEDMFNYLKEGFSLDKLRGEIVNKNSEFYFAKVSGEVVGYLKVNTGNAQTELKNQEALEIERIYVLKAFHGNRVGQALFEKAMERALVLKAVFVWLGVWEKNIKAIRFYEKNGFATFDKHVFLLGNDAQTDLMMKREL